VAYTAKDDTTNVLSGISATAITTIVPSGATVWSGLDVGEPTSCAVIDGCLELDIPPDSTHSGIPIKFRFLRKLPELTSFASTTLIPFSNALSYFVASNIERRKRNFDESDRYLNLFKSKVADAMARYKIQTKRAQQIYTLNNTARVTDFDDIWWQ
jgi:hypothetical protein